MPATAHIDTMMVADHASVFRAIADMSDGTDVLRRSHEDAIGDVSVETTMSLTQMKLALFDVFGSNAIVTAYVETYVDDNDLFVIAVSGDNWSESYFIPVAASQYACEVI